jgi:hypothetical protein
MLEESFNVTAEFQIVTALCRDISSAFCRPGDFHGVQKYGFCVICWEIQRCISGIMGSSGR